ncbi:hypothetical protein KIN20_001966 [Parelaphostrongylus tenuis]|uniref:Transmembrane protein 138 n=1 Tax=Parelaphostrongylus tenuis TaxID=148309 RepID=A0AAD5LZ60_PARTN|nr:hypothetical protein KIN20_001966 [Parelaphostrongylus tenuis]
MGSKYPLSLGVQIGMLLADLTFNVASVLMFRNQTVLLMMYILQDTLILLSVVVLVIAFSSTFVFQAGLIFLLFRRFAPTLISALIYLGFTITFHYVSLNIRWDNPMASIYFTPYILILYVAQKYCSVIHYAMYKRGTLLLVDPKYHGDSEWLRSKIRKSN